jgi:hypothetical protein
MEYWSKKMAHIPSTDQAKRPKPHHMIMTEVQPRSCGRVYGVRLKYSSYSNKWYREHGNTAPRKGVFCQEGRCHLEGLN